MGHRGSGSRLWGLGFRDFGPKGWGHRVQRSSGTGFRALGFLGEAIVGLGLLGLGSIVGLGFRVSGPTRL